ncbi:hypothetical protein, partial [Pseudomonas sp. Irchel s3a18]|uniref:hypothetical protein n=1 Tax=Pseudomonas sp. Irchel s3a18 TaxID=2009053 RepID=UPI001C4704AF
EHEVGSLAFEFSRKGTALFGHLTPRSGEHSHLNGCPVSLDHYTPPKLVNWLTRLVNWAESLVSRGL